MRIHSYMMWGAIVLAGCSAGTEPDAFATLGVAGEDGPFGSGGATDEGDGLGGSSAGDDPADGGTTADPDGGPSASEGTSVGDSEGGSDTGGGGGGTVDATAFPSIQDAIDSLEGIGGAVYIPAGTHFIPEKLKVYSNITVFGAGMDQTILRFEPGVPKDDMISNDSTGGLENIVIRDLTLQGEGPDPGINTCCFGLKLRNVHNSFVIGVSSRDHGQDGFYFGVKPVDGVPMGVYQTRLSGCHASGNGRNGFSIVQGDDNIIDGCTFENNNTNEAVSAIDLEPETDSTHFVRRNRILNNTVRNNANNGIQMWAEGGAIVAENAICYNSLENNAGTGIADHQSDDDVFVGNTFSGNGAEADYDGSAKVGDQFAELCGPDLPPLPAVPPLP